MVQEGDLKNEPGDAIRSARQSGYAFLDRIHAWRGRNFAIKGRMGGLRFRPMYDGGTHVRDDGWERCLCARPQVSRGRAASASGHASAGGMSWLPGAIDD